jgi:glycosyltransferase involved in cell wall biosynthesis
MRILYLNPGGSAHGGAERSLALLIAGMVSRGHEAYVKLLAPGDAGRLFSSVGATVIGVEGRAVLARTRRHGSALSFAIGAVRSVPEVLHVARSIRSLAGDLQADVVHSNGFRSHILAPLLRPGGPPQLWSLRDVAPVPLPRAALRVSSLAVDAIVANSRATAAQVAGRPGVVVIPNPVSTFPALPDQASARAALGLPLDRTIIAVIAHLHPTKGHHVAIEALECWDPASRPVIAIAGGSIYPGESEPYEAKLHHLVRERALEHDVVFLGSVEDVSVVYAAADVVVHPAVHPEGFARVVVEAQMTSVPVVATALGGVLDLIDDGKTGWLVPPGNAGALYSAVDSVCRDRDAARAMAARALSSAERFAPERHVDAFEAVYQKVESSR